MKIISVKKHSQRELISKLKNISLFKNPEIKIYKKCLITLEKLAIESISPTQKYVLKADCQKVQQLYDELLKFNIDLHELNGYITITTLDENNEETEIDILPVVIEESIENGRVLAILNDGMHRCCHAKVNNIILQVVYIRGVDTNNYPYYAYPLENGWDDVKDVFEVIPEGYVKKNYRYPDNYKFYFRDFNSQFKLNKEE